MHQVSEAADQARATTAVQSVDRAVTILELLARLGEAGVADVAEELDVHKSTAFRLMRTLEARGLLEQSEDRSVYRIGLGLIRIAGSSAARTDVVSAARPTSRRLATETGETVNVAVLGDGTAHYLDQVFGSAGMQPYNWVGLSIPLHATSDGKMLLAHLDRAEVDRLLPRLEAHTDRTVVDRTALHRELERVRERGYAVTVDELEEGLTAMAAPIRDAHGDVVASLSISGSTYRLDDRARAAHVEPLVGAAREISLGLGWSGAA